MRAMTIQHKGLVLLLLQEIMADDDQSIEDTRVWYCMEQRL